MTDKELGIENDMPYGWTSKDSPLWHFKVKKMWRNMHDRCKNPNNPSYSYYKDSKILDDFNKLSEFVSFIESQSNFEEFCSTCHEVSWAIDKDIKVDGNKNYYPEFMSLVTKSENSKERNIRKGHPSPKKIL